MLGPEFTTRSIIHLDAAIVVFAFSLRVSPGATPGQVARVNTLLRCGDPSSHVAQVDDTIALRGINQRVLLLRLLILEVLFRRTRECPNRPPESLRDLPTDRIDLRHARGGAGLAEACGRRWPRAPQRKVEDDLDGGEDADDAACHGEDDRVHLRLSGSHCGILPELPNAEEACGDGKDQRAVPKRFVEDLPQEAEDELDDNLLMNCVTPAYRKDVDPVAEGWGCAGHLPVLPRGGRMLRDVRGVAATECDDGLQNRDDDDDEADDMVGIRKVVPLWNNYDGEAETNELRGRSRQTDGRQR